jgi:hypothetical protein
MKANLLTAIKTQNFNAVVSHATGFKYQPKKGFLAHSKNSLRLDDCTAWSYGHWCYFRNVDGLNVFNAYRYSVTTSKHQHEMRSLLRELGVHIDVEIESRAGISGGFGRKDVADCLRAQIARKQAELAKCKRKVSGKRDQLECDLCLLETYMHRVTGESAGEKTSIAVIERDASLWGASDQGVHRLDPSESDLADAFETAERDGFDTVYVYRTKARKPVALKLVGGAK